MQAKSPLATQQRSLIKRIMLSQKLYDSLLQSMHKVMESIVLQNVFLLLQQL